MDVTPDELRARIGARIRELLQQRHMTITELAANAEVSRAHLYRVMIGRTAPSSDVLARLASALRVDPSALVRPYRGKAPAPPTDGK